MDCTKNHQMIDDRINALLGQVEAAAKANSYLMHVENGDKDIVSIVEDLQTLAKTNEHISAACPPSCTYHAKLDAVLRRTDRLLQGHRQCVSVRMRAPDPRLRDTRYEVYSNLAALESFAACVKSVAYQLLSDNDDQAHPRPAAHLLSF